MTAGVARICLLLVKGLFGKISLQHILVVHKTKDHCHIVNCHETM